MFTLAYSTARALSTTALAALSFVNSAVAIVIDVVVYHHAVSMLQCVGIAIVTAATVFLTRTQAIR